MEDETATRVEGSQQYFRVFLDHACASCRFVLSQAPCSPFSIVATDMLPPLHQLFLILILKHERGFQTWGWLMEASPKKWIVLVTLNGKNQGSDGIWSTLAVRVFDAACLWGTQEVVSSSFQSCFTTWNSWWAVCCVCPEYPNLVAT